MKSGEDVAPLRALNAHQVDRTQLKLRDEPKALDLYLVGPAFVGRVGGRRGDGDSAGHQHTVGEQPVFQVTGARQDAPFVRGR